MTGSSSSSDAPCLTVLMDPIMASGSGTDDQDRLAVDWKYFWNFNGLPSVMPSMWKPFHLGGFEVGGLLITVILFDRPFLNTSGCLPRSLVLNLASGQYDQMGSSSTGRKLCS